MATHSIGLARSMAQQSLSVRRVDHGVSRIEPFERLGNLTEFLGEMGYSGWREVGFRSLLLVEGATDVPVFRALLKLYNLAQRFVVLPLGGHQTINQNAAHQLQELKLLCENVTVVIDSERRGAEEDIPDDRQAFRQMCLDANVPCHILERRATENYFTERAVQECGFSEALTAYQKLDELENRWRKSDNWKIANRLRQEDVIGTDLHTFMLSLDAG